jgi:hypothetical protein
MPTSMTTPQAILIIGGMLNILISSLAGYLVLWIRTRDPRRPISRYAVTTHTSAILNGVLLLSLSVAIVHTGFINPINVAIALAEVAATLLSTVRNIISWSRGFNDSIAEGGQFGIRTRGLVNIVHLINATAILYGVTRTALGI